MASQPWKPNHFLFDLTFIFLIVLFIVWVITKLTLHQMNQTSWVIASALAILLTVIGRTIQNWRARRNNWVEDPEPYFDKEPNYTYSEQTQQEWKRIRHGHMERSIKNGRQHYEQMKQERNKRSAEIQDLESTLDELKWTKVDFTNPVSTSIDFSETLETDSSNETDTSTSPRSSGPKDIVL